MPPLNLTLTVEQEFQLQVMRSQVDGLAIADLRELILNLAKQNMAQQNALKSLLKPGGIADA